MKPDERFQCVEGCTRCCTDKGHPLELTAGDIVRLCRQLSIGGRDFFDRYCEIIWNRVPDSFLLIPSVGLKFPCVFLQESTCAVYDVRPIHCRLFPEALVVDNCGPGIYRNCGYQCIDKGFDPSMYRKVYIRRLKDIDRHELRATASCFDNFKYCAEIKTEQVKDINSLLSQVHNMEKTATKRELYYEMIDRRHRERVESVFMKKMEKLDMKLLEEDISYLTVISKSFRDFA